MSRVNPREPMMVVAFVLVLSIGGGYYVSMNTPSDQEVRAEALKRHHANEAARKRMVEEARRRKAEGEQRAGAAAGGGAGAHARGAGGPGGPGSPAGPGASPGLAPSGAGGRFGGSSADSQAASSLQPSANGQRPSADGPQGASDDPEGSGASTRGGSLPTVLGAGKARRVRVPALDAGWEAVREEHAPMGRSLEIVRASHDTPGDEVFLRAERHVPEPSPATEGTWSADAWYAQVLQPQLEQQYGTTFAIVDRALVDVPGGSGVRVQIRGHHPKIGDVLRTDLVTVHGQGAEAYVGVVTAEGSATDLSASEKLVNRWFDGVAFDP